MRDYGTTDVRGAKVEGCPVALLFRSSCPYGRVRICEFLGNFEDSPEIKDSVKTRPKMPGYEFGFCLRALLASC